MKLFEFNELSFIPLSVKNSLTDLLGSFVRVFRVYQPTHKALKSLCDELKLDGIVDLCSGRGEHFGKNWHSGLRVELTDLYPNQRGDLPENFSYHSQPVDLRQVTQVAGKKQVCTVFTALHHFDDQTLSGFFGQLAKGKRPFLGAEFTERRALAFLQVVMALPLWFVLPLFMRPWNGPRLFWTYVVPIVPFFMVWDGVVSCLRSRTSEEWRKLLPKMPGYQFSVTTHRSGFFKPVNLVVVGRPI